ncbi:MAG: sensor histidine kinase, partial [Zymomonas mobilis subsp. pomaceae]
MKINATLNPSVSSDKQKAVAILDSEDHLIKADNLIAALHAHNGGEKNAPLACAPLNRIIHLARRLQTRISRRILLVDINKKQDLWVEAIPKADGSILLEITGWAQEISSTEDSKIADNRIDHAISLAKKPISVRQEDVPVESKEPLLDRDNSENFDDETARWQWQADAHLNLTYFPPALEAMTGLDPDLYLHRPFARLFTLETDAEGRFPIKE